MPELRLGTALAEGERTSKLAVVSGYHKSKESGIYRDQLNMICKLISLPLGMK